MPEYMLEMKKMSKGNRKKMAVKVPARKRISTEPLLDKKRRERRQKRMRRKLLSKSETGQPLAKKAKIATDS